MHYADAMSTSSFHHRIRSRRQRSAGSPQWRINNARAASRVVPLTPFRWWLGYGAAAVLFLAMDACWLTWAADRLYRPALGHLLAPGFELAPAVLFYLLYVAGMAYFAIAPAVAAGRAVLAARSGAFLGLLAYATYDLTNQATLQGWPWAVTLADLCWGTFATGTASAMSAWMVLRWSAYRAAR